MTALLPPNYSVPVHELKAWCVYFQRVWTGDKTFEIRYDDRGYQKGDGVVIREWDRDADCTCTGRHRRDCYRYSGREIHATIGVVIGATPGHGSQRGFRGDGYVVFSLCNPELIDNRQPKTTSPADAIHRVAHAGGLD